MADTIERLNAALGGRYEIGREIGEGGMATVHLADDLKHERKVALKVLKPELAAVVGADRFLAEIKTTANLQHPHILPLYDSGEADGLLFYVMPYVEGESLRERLDREHQLSVDDAVRITTNMAEALDYAHRQGVIHRDIKPANVLLQDGKPVISDFGIALAVSAGGGSRLTETGLSLGTPHYMSPEQATGDQNVGPATDVWALGCVLYEMLVGEPPFIGSTPQAVLGKIITRDSPSASVERASVPTNVDAAIRKALEKLPPDRFSHSKELAEALANPWYYHGERLESGTGWRGSWDVRSASLAALSLVLSIGLVSALFLVPDEDRAFPIRTEVSLPPDVEALPGVGRGIDLAPDGQSLVFVGVSGGGSRLWLRRLNETSIIPLAGTDDARYPRFSPDGRTIAFAAGGALKTVSSIGGEPVVWVSRGVPDRRGGLAWVSGESIVFRRAGTGLWRVSAPGAEPEEVTRLEDPNEGRLPVEHVWPEALPTGEAILFTEDNGSFDVVYVAVVSLETGEVTRLVEGTTPRYVASGHIMFVTPNGMLNAVPFDADRLEVTGDPRTLTDRVWSGIEASAAYYDVSRDGTLLVYHTGTEGGVSQRVELVWVSRDGQRQPVDSGWVFEAPASNFGWRLSPDGQRIAVTVREEEVRIWTKELRDGRFDPLTPAGRRATYPAWTPDGGYVTYWSGGTVRQIRADGSELDSLVVDSWLLQLRWSHDGEWLVARTAGFASQPGARDVVGAWVGGDGAVVPLAASPEFWEQAPSLSRDSKWLAYASNRSGRQEVYVRPFPAVDVRHQISREGGHSPLWSPTADELFFFDDARQLVSARVGPGTGPNMDVGFDTLFRVGPEYRISPNTDFYDVTSDGERFLMARLTEMTDGGARLVLVQNFDEELQRLVPN